MRIAIVLAVPFVMGFGPAQDAPDARDAPQALLDMPGYSRPARLPSGDLGDFVRRAACSDTIEHARRASGQPPLEKESGSDAPEPMLYKAVDHDVDGCDVLVMADDPDDLRPVPEGGPVVIQGADGN